MKKLVQKVFDINPALMSDSVRLQNFLNKMSDDNWEYCGQLGIFYIFKRWEEEPDVVKGGSSSFRNQSNDTPYFGGYSPNPPSYGFPNQQYQHQQYRPQYRESQVYDPTKFGTLVEGSDKNDNIYNR